MNNIKGRCLHLSVCRRRNIIIFSSLVLVLYLVYYLFLFNSPIRINLSQKDSPRCVFPTINPYDPTILKYIKHPPPKTCEKVQPYLTFMDTNGYLRINLTELNYLSINSTFSKITCWYKTFDRSPGKNDQVWTFEPELILNQSVQLKQDMVYVRCLKYTTKGNQTIYRNIHAHPAKRINNTFTKPTENQLSVVINVIDSVSFSELQRNMPLTYSYITDKMKMFMFKHLNKVADNTLPNMFAVLTGKRIFPEQDDMAGELNYKWPYYGYYDHFNLIWKNYSAQGYATVFNEDQPDYGLFHYATKGFVKKPVDYYYPIFWRVLEKEMTEMKYEKLCFGNIPKGEVLLDILNRHLMSLNDTLQFIINFSTEYSHDYNNEVEKLDFAFAQFWKKVFEGGYLNKTAVIFMSDHGHRFGILRSTVVGLLEERNPFFGIWFPDWFYKLHPNIKENLKINTERLSGTFDIHETLKDILNTNYDGKQRPNESRGLSQLYPIPLNRTCAQAGIPEHHCLCLIGSPINISLSNLTDAANAFVTHLNSILHPYKNKCQNIVFKKIIRAETLRFSEKVKQGVKNYESLSEFYKTSRKTNKSEVGNLIRLTIKTQPNGAMFEALLFKNNTKSNWSVNGDVERLNAYGNTSYCINNVILRKYCTCVR